MQTLEEQVKQLQKNVTQMPKSMPLNQATQIDNMQSVLNAIPTYKDNAMQRFAKGAIAGLEGMVDVVPAIKIYGQQANLAMGGYFGAKPETIERKALNLATSYRNFQATQQERYKYSNPEDTNSMAYGLGQGAFNYGLMLVGGGLAGGTAKALGATAAREITIKSAAGLTANALLENVEQQSERMPLNAENEVDVNQLTPEWARKSVGGTTAYLAVSTVLEKGFGFGKQVKMWETPVKTSSKAIKVSSPVVKMAAKTALSEGATEGLQSLSSTGILLAEGKIDVSQLPQRLQDAWKEAVIGGILGGVSGTAVGINQANNVKTMLNEEIGKVVTDPEECEKVVDAIYESGTIEMTNVISKELELSSELNTKHGAIYDNMQGAIFDAINNAGAFQGVEEAELAQYVSETSKMFANQVLAEANKRGVLIDEVLKAGDIKYENGKIKLQAGKEVIAETTIIQEPEAVTPTEQTQAAESTTEETTQETTAETSNEYNDFNNLKDDTEKLNYIYNKFGRGSKKLALMMLADGLTAPVVGYNNMYSIGNKSITKAQYNKALKIYEFLSNARNNAYDTAFGNTTADKQSDTKDKQITNVFDEITPAKMDKNGQTKLFQEANKLYQEMRDIDKTGTPYNEPTININGVERPTTNSEGNAIAKTKEAIEHFYKWFGDSKVVDEKGRPLVVYHGTQAEFEEFDGGAFFTDDYMNADGYASGENVFECYLKMETPFVVDAKGRKWDKLKNKYGSSTQEIISNVDDSKYDGVIFENINDSWIDDEEAGDISTVYFPFKNTQIKSVDNKGTFDPYNPNIYYQSAYHGTPHNFDAFSLDAIGSGEGAQAHGWGLYFAENKEVSERYRRGLTVNKAADIKYDGKPIEDIINPKLKMGVSVNLLSSGHYNKAEILDRLNELYDNRKEWLEKYTQQGKKEDIKRTKNEIKKFENDIKIISNIDESKIEYANNGQLFEVDIPENDVLLDEDKPFNEQPKKVQEAIMNLPVDMLEEINIENDDVTGEDIYGEIVNQINKKTGYKLSQTEAEKQASLLLNKHGIKGITYDGRQDGTSYVIFDDKAINILNKFYQLKGLPKQQQTFRGAYDVSAKAIELFKDADYSTLPHELAHFWLDNMWQFSRSGKASEGYMNNFNGVLDWLGVKDGQINLTRAQQEKFARGYEKYLYNGYAPNGLIQGAFDDYDRWLQKVYKDAKELRVKLNADAIEFFDTMTTGELPEYDVPETQAEIQQKNIEQMNKDIEETKKIVVEKQAQFNNYDGGNVITKDTVPVTTEGEKKQSRAYTNQAAILGIAEELNYNKADIAEQNQKATEFVKNNLDEARQIVNGQKEAPADILKNAIYNAYLKEMLAIGDNEAYLNALHNQSLELTRAGQEIASQRGAIENIFDSAYWIRRIENLKKMRLASNKFGFSDNEQAINKMNNFIKNKVDEVMPEFMEATPEQQQKIAEKLSKEIAAEFKTKPDTTLYQTMREPVELRTRTNAYNYIYRYINGALGLELSRAQANEIIAKSQAIQKSIETTRNRNGNPSALFFKNISDMEAFANSIEPSPALAILTSTVGRGNMLFSPKTISLNIESNIINFLTEAVTRRIANQAVEQAVDPQVIKDYLAYSREVFNTSGYQVSSMPTLDPTTQILSEKMTTTAGDRAVDKLGRFFEQTIFKYGLSYPDLYFKDMTFVDTANLLATKETNGDSKKATELFKDICLIEPKTATGKRLREIAINEALVATYQNKGKTSDLALGIRNAINKASGSLNLGDMLSPFVKTPANVIGLGFDYSMGGLLALRNIKTIYNDIQNGTFTDATRQSVRSLARNGIGFVAAMMIANMLDDDDYIPEYALLSPKERELVKMKGGVFNSIKIGNKYVSLDYFGPVAMPLVAILNARRGNTTKDQVWNYFQGAGYQALKLPVIGDLKNLLEGTGRTLTKDADTNLKTFEDASIDFVTSRAIPAIVTDISKMTDMYERETNNDALKRLQSKVPVWREELPAKYNYGTGRPVETQNPLNVLFAGARVKDEISSSVIREINRLSKKNPEQSVGISKVTKSGKLSALSESQKNNVEKEFAQKYANEVNNLIHSDYYRSFDDSEKVKAINKVRDKVRDEIKVEYGLKEPPKPKRRYRRRGK